MRYILSILLCLWASPSWALAPWFLGVAGGGGAVAGPTYYLEDNFNSASSTEIESHSPDTGGAWSDSILDKLYALSGTLSSTQAGAKVWAKNAATTPDNTTVTVKATINDTTSSNSIAACARISTTYSGYCAILSGDGSVGTYRYADGAYAGTLDANSITLSGSTEYTVIITVTGTTISWAVKNGGTTVNSGSSTDSNLTSGKSGLWMNGTTPRINSITGE